jgi:hypothetical protein
MGDNQEIFKKIDEMYNLVDEDGKQKNKAFFSHLIRAYLPKNSVSVALVNPESKKIKVKCVFTKKALITKEGVVKEMNSSAFERNLEDFLCSFDKDKGCFVSVTPMKQLLKGRVLALQGKDTKTYMSQESYATFINWVMTKYLSGDKNIIWLLNQMTKNPFHPGITVKKKRKPQKKSFSTGSKKSTLGDLSALQALKEKFKNEE